MTRSASDLPGRARPSNKQPRAASGPPARKPPQRLGLRISRRVKQLDQSPIVLTVAHSTRTVNEFISLLLAHGVKQLDRCANDPTLKTQPAV